MDATGVLFQVIFSILVFINLVGNTLVCIVVLRTKSMRIPMNYLLVNLAVADMTVALFIVPHYILRPIFKHPEGPLGDFLCKTVTGGTLSWVGLAASVFTLGCIAFERYHSIMYPHSHKGRLTTRKAQCGIALSWFLGVASEIPSIAVVKYNKPHAVCIEDWPHINQARAYTVASFFLDFALPFTLMSVLYGRVLQRLWNNRISKATQVALLKRRKRVTKLLATVTALHGICLLPDTVAYVLSYCGFKYGSIAYRVGTVFVCLNSTMNPFLYSLHSERFRRSLRKLVRGTRERVRLEVKAEEDVGSRPPSLRRPRTSIVSLH